MIAPTKMYNCVPTLSPEQAADLVVEAIGYKPVRIATRLGIFGQLLHALVPRVAMAGAFSVLGRGPRRSVWAGAVVACALTAMAVLVGATYTFDILRLVPFAFLLLFLGPGVWGLNAKTQRSQAHKRLDSRASWIVATCVHSKQQNQTDSAEKPLAMFSGPWRG